MMDELIEAGIKTKEPFTVDPMPIDYDNVECTDASEESIQYGYIQIRKDLFKNNLKN